MKSLKFLINIISLALVTHPSQSQDLTKYVDPYIGSGGHGHVFVGASVPFGAVQLGPSNFFKGWDWCSGYNYGDSIVTGFAHMHLSGTGIGDLGDILVMPYIGEIRTGKSTEKEYQKGYCAHYSHKNEMVQPGYYAVKLDGSNIKVELTATERVGFHQYQFPQGKQAHVIVDLKEGINDQSAETYIRQVDQYTLEGYRFSKGWAKEQLIFFAVRSSEPLKHFAVYDDNKLLQGDSGKGKSIKGLISFDKAPSTLKLKVGISPVSCENALTNINAEIPHWNFNKVVAEAKVKWNTELSKIIINTPSEKDKRIFYTALFHTMIDPALFNDHNGDYRGADKQVYKHASFANYSVFSLWDTYRAVHPLYTITQPQRTADMVNSMLAIYDQKGLLPQWHLEGWETGTMVGIASRQVIAEAYLKGIKGFDVEKAFNAIKGTSSTDTMGMMYVKTFAPIPADKERRSVAKGLEYAIGDGSIALMAKALNKQNEFDYFSKRALNYKLYFDSATQFYRGKLENREWVSDFNALKANNTIYAEGNAWQYLWLVPQDVKGLITLLGGEKNFNNRLDSMFSLETTADEKGLADLTGTIGQYAHGNEPSHHIAYLYAYGGRQWKTSETVRHIMKDMYHDQPDGIIGNEDCGQMSAWYIFSALGFYPVFPADGRYVFGSPLVENTKLQLPNGKTFTVKATGASTKPYIKKVLLNGKPYDAAYIDHTTIMAGGTLEFIMSDIPNKDAGYAVKLKVSLLK
jgi:predicted alpha-1,2-mannosidase